MSDWTECREGYMPRVGEVVLFWAKGWTSAATPGIGKFDGELWEDETQTEGYAESPVFLHTSEVSHWMPIPKPPVGVGK